MEQWSPFFCSGKPASSNFLLKKSDNVPVLITGLPWGFPTWGTWGLSRSAWFGDCQLEKQSIS